jgi:hypothetical protein
MVWRGWSGLSFPVFYFFEREREKRNKREMALLTYTKFKVHALNK